jgi:exosome complex component MTR3
MFRRDQSVPYCAEPRPSDVITIEGKRLDGRASEEFRKVCEYYMPSAMQNFPSNLPTTSRLDSPVILPSSLCCPCMCRAFVVAFPVLAVLKTGVISQAAGSSYVEFGKTKLMVGVYGPRQSERREAYSESGRVNVDVKIASFATRQRGKFYQSTEERDLSSQVQTALEAVVDMDSFPKSVLDVYCTVLEAGGAEMAVAITAASLAVADAGVEMQDIVTACSVAKVKGALLLDPSEDEAYREEAGLVVAVGGQHGEIASTVARGKWNDNELQEAFELCLGGCGQLDPAARAALKPTVDERRMDGF